MPGRPRASLLRANPVKMRAEAQKLSQLSGIQVPPTAAGKGVVSGRGGKAQGGMGRHPALVTHLGL